jgi:hypothetical protein
MHVLFSMYHSVPVRHMYVLFCMYHSVPVRHVTRCIVKYFSYRKKLFRIDMLRSLDSNFANVNIIVIYLYIDS